MQASRFRKWRAMTCALLLTTVARAGVGPRSKCDNERSRLCDGLVAVYEFEEGLNSESVPTYPDAVRRNAFGAGDLYEPNGINVGAGSTQITPSTIDNGMLGRNGAGSFYQPTDITGLKLWLKADALTSLADGDAVGSWTDSSVSGYNFTQATANLKPTYKTGIVNGKPVVRFDGSDDYLTGTTLNNLVTNSAGTMFVVFRYDDSSPVAQALLGDTSATAQTAGPWAYANSNQYRAYNYDGTADHADKTSANAVWYIGTWLHSGGNVYAGLSDTRTASMASVASGNMSGAPTASVGAAGNPIANHLDGDIAELIVYNAALSEADRQKVESYLSDKYQVGVPYPLVGNGSGVDADAADFDGATHYLHLGADIKGAGVLGNSPWTVAFWYNADTAGANGTKQYLWSERGKLNGSDVFGADIYLESNGTALTPKVTVYDGLTAAAQTVAWGSALSTGSWRLLVVTFRPRDLLSNGELTLAVDAGTRVTGSLTGNFGIRSGVGPIIGRSADPGVGGFFDGRLDQLTISAIVWEALDEDIFYRNGLGQEYPFTNNSTN